MRRLTLYGHPGCHLCDEAREMIEGLLRDGDGSIELDEVDISTDERLHRLYLERIPVIEFDGAIVSELIPDPSALRAALLHNSPR